MPFTPQIQKAVIADNLRTQNRELDRQCEIRRAYLQDAAHWLIDRIAEETTQGRSFDEALTRVSEILAEEKDLSGLPFSADDMWQISAGVARGAPIADPAPPAALRAPVVHFVQNPGAMRAYELLCRSGAYRASGVADVREAIAEAGADPDGYCLLPESEGGERLSRIASLARRSDLRLHALLPVDDMVFGFYSVSPPSLGDDPGPRLIEWRLSEKSAEACLLSVAGHGYLTPDTFRAERGESSSFTYLRAYTADRFGALCAWIMTRLFFPSAELIAMAAAPSPIRE
ncbi:MAG: hypothetical protein J6125_04585 [Clostridia bacterium]|nr:hypothetical protein [Clostridia bacterium]